MARYDNSGLVAPRQLDVLLEMDCLDEFSCFFKEGFE